MPEIKNRVIADEIESAILKGHGMHEMLDRMKNSILVHTLNREHGNITHAAKTLKIHRNNVANWLKKYNIRAEDFRNGNGNH